ncbi:hypothetical protein H0H93_005883 [Arthromyces matolae]|nr:hypothetical protein H0H93_005883 [Arthromyces matolae]
MSLFPDCSHADIVHTVMDGFNQLGSMEPLQEPTTPGRQRKFLKTIHLLQSCLGQMESHASFLLELSREWIDEEIGEENVDNDMSIELVQNILLRLESEEPELPSMKRKRSDSEPSRSREDEEGLGDKVTPPPSDDTQDRRTTGRDSDQEQEDTESVTMLKRKRKSEAKIDARLAKVWPKSFSHRFNIATLVDRMLTSKIRTQAQREEQGLMWLVTGYEETTVEILSIYLEDAHLQPLEPQELLQLCAEVDEEENLTNNLLARERIAWNRLSKQAKTTYLDEAVTLLDTEAYQEARRIADKKRREVALQPGDDCKKLFAETVYDGTSSSFDWDELLMDTEFGAGILLDRGWELPENIKMASTQTFGVLLRSFRKSLEKNLAEDGEELPVADFLASARSRSYNLLRQLLESVDCSDVWEWVQEFLNGEGAGLELSDDDGGSDSGENE